MRQNSTSDAKFRASQIVSRMAFEYVNNLQPGDRFLGPQVEAAKHFDVGSEGYELFVGCALHKMGSIVMDLDKDGCIISIVPVRARH
jgi:hypothetical protein